MTVHRISEIGSYASNMYLLIGDGIGAVVDPSLPYERLLPYLPDEPIKIAYCFVTHAHFDHFLEAEDILAHTGARLIVGGPDAHALSNGMLNASYYFLGQPLTYDGAYEVASEADTFSLGSDTLRVLHTPGHSRGSITLSCEGALFVGDVMFEGGSYGRTDLVGGDGAVLRETILRLLQLPGDPTVYAGHGRPFLLSSYEKYL